MKETKQLVYDPSNTMHVYFLAENNTKEDWLATIWFKLDGLHIRAQTGFYEQTFFSRVLLWQEKLPAS